MSGYTLAFTGVFILGVGIGVLLCLIFETVSRRRRERNHTRRQFQLETESLRRDFESLRRDVDRICSANPLPLNPCSKNPTENLLGKSNKINGRISTIRLFLNLKLLEQQYIG